MFGIVSLGLPQLNDAVVYLPLHAAQDWLSATDRVTAVIIVPEAAASVQAVAERLRAQLGPRFETMSWQEMLPEIDKHMHGDAVNFYI